MIVLPLLCTDKLGFTQYGASNWCFIKEASIYKSTEHSMSMSVETVTLMFVAGKFWEILSYVFVVVMYGITRYKFHKQVCIKDTSG